MNLKKWAPAVLAIVLGGVAAMLARNMMNKSKPTAPTVAVQVVTATGPLMVGQEIKPENVALTTIPALQPPPNDFTNPADVIGHTLTSSLLKGQHLTTGDLAPMGVAAGLQSLIPPGKRAITINIDETNGQVGMLLPGCRIDVLATVVNGKASVTRPIVTNVLIQATGVRLNSAKPEKGEEAPGPYHTLTLIVTVREAELLELASTSSRVRVLLRGTRKAAPGEDDDDTESAEGITMADLTGSDSSGSNGAVAAANSTVAVGQNNRPTTMPSNSVTVSRPKWTVELIKGAGGNPVRVDFDMPKPVMVDTVDDLSPAIPGAVEKPER